MSVKGFQGGQRVLGDDTDGEFVWSVHKATANFPYPDSDADYDSINPGKLSRNYSEEFYMRFAFSEVCRILSEPTIFMLKFVGTFSFLAPCPSSPSG